MPYADLHSVNVGRQAAWSVADRVASPDLVAKGGEADSQDCFLECAGRFCYVSCGADDRSQWVAY
jgi:hypothetical protein